MFVLSQLKLHSHCVLTDPSQSMLCWGTTGPSIHVEHDSCFANPLVPCPCMQSKDHGSCIETTLESLCIRRNGIRLRHGQVQDLIEASQGRASHCPADPLPRKTVFVCSLTAHLKRHDSNSKMQTPPPPAYHTPSTAAPLVNPLRAYHGL